MSAVREFVFVDYTKDAPCILVVPDDGRVFPNDGEAKIGVRHPRCDVLADLAVELDCFYCQACAWNGRVSGAWAVDMIEAAPIPEET